MLSKYYTLLFQSLTANRGLILETLKPLAIDSVTVSYAGGGDSGDTDQITTTPEEHLAQLETATVQFMRPSIKSVDGKSQCLMEEQRMGLNEALREFTLAWVNQAHGSWANDEGGSGEMVIDVKQDTFTLGHHEYFRDSEYHEASL